MLTQIRFPSCTVKAVQQFLKTANELVEAEPHPSTRTDYEYEIEQLSELQIANRLGLLIPELAQHTTPLSDEIDAKRSGIMDELQERFPEPDYEGDDSRPSGGLSIDEILSDL